MRLKTRHSGGARRRPITEDRSRRRRIDRPTANEYRQLAEDYLPHGVSVPPYWNDVPNYDDAPPMPKNDDDLYPNRRRRGISRLGQNLRQLCESHGSRFTALKLRESLDTGELNYKDFSVRELAEAFCGEQWVENLNPNRHTGGYRSVMEAGTTLGVDVSAFQDIVGQIFFTVVAEGWKNATLVGDKLFEKHDTVLDGEKIPWLGHVIQEGSPIQPGMPYPEAAFGERYVTTPSTTKWGMIVSLSKEMVFFDRTGQAMRAGGEVGWKLGYNREKRQLVVFLGMTNTYSLNGTTFNTFNFVGTPPSYVNAQSGTPLVDYSSLQTPMTLFSQILDPDTLNPLDSPMLKQMFVLPAFLLHARAVLKATEYWGTNPAFNSSPTAPTPYGNLQMHSPNPYEFNTELLTSPIAYQLLVNGSAAYAPTWAGLTATQANAYWWLGDFQRSFWYMQNWPIQVIPAPAQNVREFESDVVARFKATERGTAAVFDPRYTCRLNNT